MHLLRHSCEADVLADSLALVEALMDADEVLAKAESSF